MTQRAIRFSRHSSRHISRHGARPARLAARLAAAFVLGAASLATAYAADPRAMPAQDRYDYTFHAGARDPYSEGARVGRGAGGSEGSDGAYGTNGTNGAVNRQADWMPDGSSHSAALGVPFAGQLAGMDHTGVSAPPDGKHSG